VSGHEHSERIESLVKLVEANFNVERYKRWMLLRRLIFGVAPISTVLIPVLWVFFTLAGVVSSYLQIAELENVVFIIISFVALAIAIIDFSYKLVYNLGLVFTEQSEKGVANWNYERLKESVKKEDLPLLKALILMKSKEPEFSLSKIYEKNSSLFSEKNLIGMLYDLTPVPEKGSIANK